MSSSTPKHAGQQPLHWQQPPSRVVPKSPGLAVVASLVIPGLGSMISGSPGIGFIILVLYVFSWFATFPFVIGFAGVTLIWIWGMAQAYHDAVAWNAKHGLTS